MTALLHSLILEDRSLRPTEAHSLFHCWTRPHRFGLAALLSNVEETFYHGQHALMENANISWLMLRDVPGASLIQRRRKCMQRFRTTQAVLRHGMPLIDFFLAADRDLCFDSLKHSIPQRQMQVLRRLDTFLAHHSNEHRPALEEFFPVPYLAFPACARRQLYWLATAEQGCRGYLRCPSCNQCITLRCFTKGKCPPKFFEDGNFVSACPFCQHAHKWFLEDLRPIRRTRRFTPAFQKQFCSAIARGLPLKAVGPCIYRGIELTVSNPSAASQHCHAANRVELTCHVLESQIDGLRSKIYLPQESHVLTHPDQILEAGDVWAKAVADPPWPWLRLTTSQRWSTLPKVCGGIGIIGLLQRLWFEQELIWLAERPKEILLQADLLGQPCRELTPQRLYWDLEPADQQLDGMLETISFPPLTARERGSIRLFDELMVDGKSVNASGRER